MSVRHALLVALAAAACTQDSPGTSVRLALSYPSDPALDTAEVIFNGQTKKVAISHELLLLLPDALDGKTVPLEIWGRSNDVRAAHGVTTVMPVLDQSIAASLELTACAPTCDGNMLMGCGAPVTCGGGCSADGGAHCITATPSNGVDPTLADTATASTTIAMDATFNTDTGEITDGLVRAAKQGVDAGIGYYQAAASGPNGAALGIFAFHDLTIATMVKVRFTGTRAAVLLIGDTATLAGAIDVSGGGLTQGIAGPGGGAGQTDAQVAGGCGPGGPGMHSGVEDGGGGGGGGSQQGGEGGRLALHGAPGSSCLSPQLEPLAGGSGGGRGGPGSNATSAGGGGGGGALQITAFGQIEVSGTINAGGAGGEPGAAAAGDDGGGGGGGAGGGILLEAPTVLIDGGAIVAANGGGGGGGGGGPSTIFIPAPGDNGGLSTSVANGGAGGEDHGIGGTGGGPSVPDFGSDGSTNGGGGGGGGGVIMIRSTTKMVMGLTVPNANSDALHAPR